jgi:tetratricopeptide (TPR) repeat protein
MMVNTCGRARRESAIAAGGSDVSLHRGLAFALVVFAAAYAGLGSWLATGHGPLKSAFEGVRRYDAALAHGRTGLAASLGEATLALARTDAHWSQRQLAAFEAQVAETALAARRIPKALELVRSASARLAAAEPSQGEDLPLLIDVAAAHARIALATGDGLEATCTFGVLLEQLGPDRVAHPAASPKPHPELGALARHLTGLGRSLRVPSAALAPNSAAFPLTSCHLLADFYVEQEDYKAAASASDIVIAAARIDDKLTPEIHAALLQKSAHVHELLGDVKHAEKRLEEAVAVLDATRNPEASLYALEALGTFLSSWGESERALPVLQRALAVRESRSERNLPRLAPTLVALGHAQRDSADPAAAETSFKRAFELASSKHGSSTPASLEALIALGELYRDQGREAEAIRVSHDAAKLQRTGAFFADEVKQPGNVLRMSEESTRALKLRIAFRATGTPASGRASDAFSTPAAATTAGEVEIALPVVEGAAWAALWPKDRFERSANSYPRLRVGAPELGSEAGAPSQARLLFIPGEGSTFAAGAERAARLQAVAGPDIQVALAYWASGAGARGYLKNPAADAHARGEIADLMRNLGTAQGDAPIYLVAEGRGARHLSDIINDGGDAPGFGERLAALILIAPQLSSDEMRALAGRFDPKRTRITIYAAENARALLAARDVYREAPVGLLPAPIADVTGVEWIAAGIDQAAADFDTLASDALVSDIGRIVRDGPSADKRCGLARVSRARAGDAYVLNPQGCRAGAK